MKLAAFTYGALALVQAFALCVSIAFALMREALYAQLERDGYIEGPIETLEVISTLFRVCTAASGLLMVAGVLALAFALKERARMLALAALGAALVSLLFAILPWIDAARGGAPSTLMQLLWLLGDLGFASMLVLVLASAAPFARRAIPAAGVVGLAALLFLGLASIAILGEAGPWIRWPFRIATYALHLTFVAGALWVSVLAWRAGRQATAAAPLASAA